MREQAEQADPANGGTPLAFDKATISELPLRRYEGTLTLIEDTMALATALERIRRERVLGFDVEFRPSFRRGEHYPVSLMQLAGAREVWLFAFCAIPFGPELAEILDQKRIIKAGVAPADDLKRLRELHEFRGRNFVDLSGLAEKAGLQSRGLRNLAAEALGFRVSKRAQVTNWARRDLTMAQRVYAATDAWVSRELYMKLAPLAAGKKSPKEMPMRVHDNTLCQSAFSAGRRKLDL